MVLATSLLVSGVQMVQAKPSSDTPNIVLVFVDDMGYADLGVYGNPSIRTPVLDRLANEGQKWTNFYAPAAVCSPSRAGTLTGRLGIRSGVAGENESKHVFFPNSLGGLPSSEITIAELLKKKGYASAAIGKWHLGHKPEFLPTNQGFDSYFGIPYSNDMNMPGGIEEPWTVDLFFRDPNINFWDVPLMDNEKIIERPANQVNLTQRYTQKAVKFIQDNKDRPFFLYLAHNQPHTPLFASEKFQGKSPRGLYGDSVEELDWSVGQVIKTLKDLNLDDNTLVVFTSDNGPWLTMRQHGGSAGLLRDGKATTWEGGMREPAIFWWPGKIEPKVVTDLGSALDFLPTFAALAGIELPTDREFDGVDLSRAITEGEASPRDEILYYRFRDVFAVRKGAYKAHFKTRSSFAGKEAVTHEIPLLFNVNEDPSEKYDIATTHPEVIAEMRAIVAAHKKTVKPVVDQLNLYPEGQAPGEKSKKATKRPWDK